MKRTRKSVLLTGLFVALAVLCIGCGKTKTVPDDATTADSSTQAITQKPEAEIQTTAIETPFGTLYYPEKWQEQVRIVQTEGAVYTVSFFGTVGDRAELPLFDIYFGGEIGDVLGTWRTDSGEMTVRMQSFDFPFDDTWSNDDKDTICAMQEDMNTLIDRLAQEKNFKAAF